MALPALVPAVATAAEWLLPLLLSEGVGALTGSGKSPLPTPAIEGEVLAKKFKKISKRYGNEDKARNLLLRRFGERALKGTTAGGVAYKSLKPGAGTKLKGWGKMGLASLAGAAPFILLPELLGALHGGGGEMEMAGEGGSPQDLMALLGGLEGQASRSFDDTKSDFYKMLGEQQSQRALEARASQLPMAGMREDLQSLTRGYEDQLAKISYNQPMSLAQAFAMEGIFPNNPAMMDFGSNRINYP
jgi:hypothetical protein